jgi:hypothetical protein
MIWRSMRPRRNWRAFLTTEEKRELARLEKLITRAEVAAALPLERRARNRIQNRATVRAGNASQQTD